MKFYDLKGHSGCKIYLCETDDSNVFVRKISGSFTYNNRLKIQADKQANFQNSEIKVPKILDRGFTDDGMFYFDMEYLRGITLAEYMKSIEIGKVRGVVNTLVKNILRDDGVESEPKMFTDKIALLEKQLETHNNAVTDRAIKLLKTHDWSAFCKSPCHGDLTLENIIVKDDQLYFIDFLDSFYDCWLIDFGTLLQDSQVLWSYRSYDEIDINTLIRLAVFRDILMDTVRSTRPQAYIEIYYALLLKLIRIYPYTKDERTYSFLNEKTMDVLNIIMKEEN